MSADQQPYTVITVIRGFTKILDATRDSDGDVANAEGGHCAC
jgi:hypothetical protein